MTETTAPNPLARIRQDVQSMHAYAVQDSTGMLKMDAMENPHRLPPELQAELGRRLGEVAINRYPGARVDELKAALHAWAQPPEGWTKWNIPGYEYLCAKVETENTFSEVLDYMQKNQIPLVGAIQDFSCPKSGKDYMLFPIRRL